MKILSTLVQAATSPGTNKILEIGCGFSSTPVLRKIAKNKKEHCFITSLEDKIEWKTKIDKICPPNQFGEIILCPIQLINNLPIYQCNLDSKFDLVVIDGPAGNVEWYPSFRELFLWPNNPLQIEERSPKSWRGGMQSAGLMGWLLESSLIHDDTVILVDGRIASVLFYIDAFSDRFDFFFTGPEEPDIEVSRWLKQSHANMKDLKLGVCTIAVKKGNMKWIKNITDAVFDTNKVRMN